MTPGGSAGTASGSYRVEPEPAGELREVLVQAFIGYGTDRPSAQVLVAALINGPLAPLLARLRAVEELAEELDREGVVQRFHGPDNLNGHITARIRSALDAS